MHAPSLKITVRLSRSLSVTQEFNRPVEFGRQRDGEPEPIAVVKSLGVDRVIFAKRDENIFGRQQLWIEAAGPSHVLVKNLSRHVEVIFGTDNIILPLTEQRIALPCELSIGDRTISVSPGTMMSAPSQPDPPTGEEVVSALPGTEPPSIAPSSFDRPSGGGVHSHLSSASSPTTSLAAGSPSAMANEQVHDLLRNIQAVLDELQDAQHADEFFECATRALIELGGLEISRVLTHDRDCWTSRAETRSEHISADQLIIPSRALLDQVLKQRHAHWSLAASEFGGASDGAKRLLVGAPIVDDIGEVTAVLYGEKQEPTTNSANTTSPRLEATLCEIIAGSVSSGLVRLETRQAQSQTRVAQTRDDLKAPLALTNDELKSLVSHEADATVLVCEIQDLRRLSERLPVERAFDWLNEVFDELTECVVGCRGCVVDVVDDRLTAIWGALDEQPDHALLACEAGLALLDRATDINQRPGTIVGEPLRLTVGIHSGLLRVGVTGGSLRPKFSAFGATMRQAMQAQQAARQLRISLIMSEPTRRAIGDQWLHRRLGDMRLADHDAPLRLFELLRQESLQSEAIRSAYEEALDEFENRHLQRAVSLLGAILDKHSQDGPAMHLLARASAALLDPAKFEATWSFE